MQNFNRILPPHYLRYTFSMYNMYIYTSCELIWLFGYHFLSKNHCSRFISLMIIILFEKIAHCLLNLKDNVRVQSVQMFIECRNGALILVHCIIVELFLLFWKPCYSRTKDLSWDSMAPCKDNLQWFSIVQESTLSKSKLVAYILRWKKI